MPRAAFELAALLGITTTKVSSIAATQGGERIFLGTTDGSLVAYECRSDTPNAIRAGSFDCNIVEVLRKGGGKDRKPVTELAVVESWRAVISIVDNQLMAYDSHTYRPVIDISESKGALSFFVDEKSYVLYVGCRKRLQIFSWRSVGAMMSREISLPDTPRALVLAPSSNTDTLSSNISSGKLVLAIKSEYFVLDIESGVLSPPLQFGGQANIFAASAGAAPSLMTSAGSVMVPMKGNLKRGPRVLLSLGSKGILVDVNGQDHEETLNWSSPPISAVFCVAFFIAALPGQIEIHEAASLSLVQIIDMSGVICVAKCPMSSSHVGYSYVGTMQAVSLLKMIPIKFQVEKLVDSGNYEEALMLCDMCKDDPSLLGGVAVSATHERYAYDLFSYGDYEDSISHFTKAETPLPQVLALFSALLPPNLPYKDLIPLSNVSATTRPLSGSSLGRAASALVKYLESQQNAVFDTTVDDPSSMEFKYAALLDTMLICAKLQCSPPRRQAIISQLSDPTRSSRCDVAALAPVLAAAGPQYIEALLWLYRSKNLHKQILEMLSESHCVGEGGWSPSDYRKWVAKYLQSLWFADDASLPPLALQASVPLIKVDPQLGLSIFTDAHPQDIVSFLKTIALDSPEEFDSNRQAAGPLPLTNGRSLAIHYLEHILFDPAAEPARKTSSTVVSQLHDELAYLLMEGLLAELHAGDAQQIDYSKEEKIPFLARSYQLKLRNFLETSREYNPARLLAVVPSNFLVEHALLLSRLGRHDEVLHIYVRQLRDSSLAEKYCNQIWTQSQDRTAAASTEKPLILEADQEKKASELANEDAYLFLLKEYLSQQESEPHNEEPLDKAVDLLERYFTRIDPLKVLDLIPHDVALARISGFFGPAMRYYESQLRQSQVLSNLSRADFVNVKYEHIQLQKYSSFVPDLSSSFAHLGPVKRSSTPSELTDLNAECGVTCIRHSFGTHIVLQFNVSSRHRQPNMRLMRVGVHCETSDHNVVTVAGEKPLQSLPAGGTGSCYVVLQRGGSSSLSATITCELRYSVIGIGRAKEYEEEYPLEDVEINADDLL